ncbi:MAG: 16S rRNA (cytosine(967)-C(5))-methyltransferase RsmB [Oscillospiraceae bacterium]
MKSARFIVCELLEKLEKSAYSNLALDGVLQDQAISPRDKAFISRLFYGVIERRVTLDHIISLYSSKPLQKLDTVILQTLRMGIYQLLYMDSVPDNAAVNEAVELVKQLGKKSAAPFVNAVLRSFIRDGKKFSVPKDDLQRLCVEYSCSAELADRLIKQYGEEKASEFLKRSLEPHKLYLRVNNTKTDCDTLISEFAKVGITVKKCTLLDNCIEAEPFGSVENNDLFRKGLYHVQDLSSQLCCAAIDPKKGEKILDICSAPGGKSFTITEITDDECELYACELHDKRVKLIKNGAERLGLKSIKALQNDAKVFNESFPMFDKILCDVPCSGTGVIRSKPEIKYSDLKKAGGLPKIQYEILNTAAKYLKVGGELVYSTCTVLKEENELVIDRFLEENKGFEGVSFLSEIGAPFGGYKASIIAESFDCEGFFISKIRRKY